MKYILVLFEVKCINTENKRFIRCNILHNRESFLCSIGIGSTTLLYLVFYDLYQIDRTIFVICKLYNCVQKEAKACSLLLWIFFWIFSCICHKIVVPLHWIWKRYYQQLLPLNLKLFLWKWIYWQSNNRRRILSCVCLWIPIPLFPSRIIPVVM